MKLNALAARLVLATWATLAASVQAATLVIDNWNVTTPAFVSDLNVDPDPADDDYQAESNFTRGEGGTSLPRSELVANLTAGTRVTTRDSASGQQGQFISAAGSAGHGIWWWNPSTSLDLGGYSSIQLTFSTDVPGADIMLTFIEGYQYDSTSKIVAQAWWKDLPNTGGSMTSLSMLLPSSLTKVDAIALDVFSLGGDYYNPGLGTQSYGTAATGLFMRVDNLIASSSYPYWQESGDAGGLDAPQLVSPLASGISGTIGDTDTVDVFKVTWFDPARMWVKVSVEELEILYLSIFKPNDLTNPLFDLLLEPNQWQYLGWLGAGTYLLKVTTDSEVDPSYLVEFLRTVPEPATLALFGLGLAGLGAVRRRKLAA